MEATYRPPGDNRRPLGLRARPVCGRDTHRNAQWPEPTLLSTKHQRLKPLPEIMFNFSPFAAHTSRDSLMCKGPSTLSDSNSESENFL